MFGIFEETFSPSDGDTGAYLVLAVGAFLALQAAPAFLKAVLPAFRFYPMFAGGIGFWWLALSGRYILAFVALLAGLLSLQWLAPAQEERKADAPPVSVKDQGSP